MASIKIGVTERGDAGWDLSWADKLGTVDGAIIITKNLSLKCINKLLSAYYNGYKLILHCGCTGWGDTKLEPGAPGYQEQLQRLVNLFDQGFCQRQLENVGFRRKGMLFFAGQYTSVYSLNHHITCRFEARQALIYQLVLGLTGKSDKYNYSKAVHVYPPFFDIICSAKNYKIAPALTSMAERTAPAA